MDYEEFKNIINYLINLEFSSKENIINHILNSFREKIQFLYYKVAIIQVRFFNKFSK